MELSTAQILRPPVQALQTGVLVLRPDASAAMKEVAKVCGPPARPPGNSERTLGTSVIVRSDEVLAACECAL